MVKLFALCFGVTILMALSQRQYPLQLRSRYDGSGHFLRDHTDIFLLAAIIWMTCFAFLRTAYNDTGTYINSFVNASTLADGLESGRYTDWMENPLSQLYQDFMRSVTDNHHVYFLFPALLHSIAVLKLIKRYSVSPAISVFIFFSIGTYVLYLAAFKQNMALSILLLALPYALEKKYVPYVLLVLLAMLFHFYAFIYLLVPLLCGKPWGKTTWILLGITLFVLMTYDVTLGRAMQELDNLAGNIAEEELFDGNSINELRVAVYWVPGLLALLFRRYLVHEEDRIGNLFVNMSLFGAMIITIGLAQGANLFGRMAGYFEIATAVALPGMFRKIFDHRSVRLVTGAAAVLYFGYFCYEFIVSKSFDANYRAISLWQFIIGLFA